MLLCVSSGFLSFSPENIPEGGLNNGINDWMSVKKIEANNHMMYHVLGMITQPGMAYLMLSVIQVHNTNRKYLSN